MPVALKNAAGTEAPMGATLRYARETIGRVCKALSGRLPALNRAPNEVR